MTAHSFCTGLISPTARNGWFFVTKSYCCSFPDVFLDLLLLESWKDMSGKVCVKKKGRERFHRKKTKRANSAKRSCLSTRLIFHYLELS